MARLPLVKRMAYQDPLELMAKLCGKDKFLLHSGLVTEEIGRYSFLGCDPFLVLQAKDEKVTITEGNSEKLIEGNPIRELRKILQRFYRPLTAAVPFTGGAVGYFAYDLGWLFEELPHATDDDLKLPDFYLPFYDRVIVVDHFKKETLVFSHGFPLTDGEGESRAEMRIDELLKMLRSEHPSLEQITNEIAAGDLSSNFTRDQYLNMVRQGKEYIAAGDIFQVNLSQRLQVPLYISPWQLYLRLAKLNPAPFAAFLDFQPAAVVSASPERFMRLQGDRVETRPIKGTRPRGCNPIEDERLREELINSAKDRAELVMIVDLARNDLGRVCRVGTVKVPRVFRLEEYATVFHLVSTVEGTLSPALDICDLITASFPGGSITGAPKIRAMEIIEELEPTKRGIYTGSIGYIDFSGDADSNIVIRTFVIKNGTAYFQVGGGIVADSSPEAEYQETLDKAKALLDSLGKIGG
ncbi:aminodeoxychorismate synthase component I [Metallumcola ferriviriculae]|uniref:aminodeoxychorismate synthase n=1 Tax=Metallumcola ferriviriculae TaxID=3039180 RepID=A0AAU0USV9_9FIRM|nr:aminodeoxychorismate synthase component I [Desulfitibacteraceae bacterium MK1]